MARMNEQAQQELPVPGGEGPVTVYEEGYFDESGGSNLWYNMQGFGSSLCQAGILFGAEGVFLAPTSEPRARVTLTDLTNGNSYSGKSDPGLGLGFRTWVGLQNNGWGFVVRWFHFANNEIDPKPIASDGRGATFIEGFHLDLDTIDIELTQRLYIAPIQINTSFGLRHAWLERQHSVTGYGTVGDVDLTKAPRSGSNSRSKRTGFHGVALRV